MVLREKSSDLIQQQGRWENDLNVRCQGGQCKNDAPVFQNDDDDASPGLWSDICWHSVRPLHAHA